MSFAMSITVFAADQSDGLVKQLEAHQDYIHYHVDFDQIYDKANKKYYFKVYPADKYGKSVAASEISGRTTKK